MSFFKKYKINFKNSLKVLGIAVLALIVLAIGIQIVVPVTDSLISNRSLSVPGGSSSQYFDEGFAAPEMKVAYDMMDSEIVPPYPPIDDYVTGDNSEDFEITEYNATIETRELDDTCSSLLDLKAKNYVIFENSNESDYSCNFNFKVKNENVEEILTFIQEMDPKDFSENSYTIKRVIDNYSDEKAILMKKLESIEKTLNDALNSYDEISKIATKANDIESLTKLIDSKIQIIERLSQEKIIINEQLDRIEKSKSNQLDRLEFTYFYVYVYENKYIDFEDIKDSWKETVKDFVFEVNTFVQNITINLVVLALYIVQYLIYLAILIIVAKIAWTFAKYVWKK